MHEAVAHILNGEPVLRLHAQTTRGQRLGILAEDTILRPLHRWKPVRLDCGEESSAGEPEQGPGPCGDKVQQATECEDVHRRPCCGPSIGEELWCWTVLVSAPWAPGEQLPKPKVEKARLHGERGALHGDVRPTEVPMDDGRAALVKVPQRRTDAEEDLVSVHDNWQTSVVVHQPGVQALIRDELQDHRHPAHLLIDYCSIEHHQVWVPHVVEHAQIRNQPPDLFLRDFRQGAAELLHCNRRAS
mmetsp:Transcript_13796/g.31289  ORF Transcript_13796/g.31289 Transcript_13796/m.31289 type:complete len:244 (-) Transcript_13796:335-1066(-)